MRWGLNWVVAKNDALVPGPASLSPDNAKMNTLVIALTIILDLHFIASLDWA